MNPRCFDDSGCRTAPRLWIRCAGYVQMALDVAVILLSLPVLDIPRVLLSAVDGVILNVELAMDHRPERYRA